MLLNCFNSLVFSRYLVSICQRYKTQIDIDAYRECGEDTKKDQGLIFQAAQYYREQQSLFLLIISKNIL